jgi:hypothetical protein
VTLFSTWRISPSKQRTAAFDRKRFST